MKLHIFNPWHDEALAANRSHFIPAEKLRILGETLGHLPQWWKAHEDEILIIPQHFRLTPPASGFWEQVEQIEAWGWDLLLCHLLRKMGCPTSLLPSATRIAQWRQLSSRATCTQTLQWIHTNKTKLLPQEFAALLLPCQSFFCHNMAEVASALNHCQHKVMVKRPWSSSGRGVFPLRKPPTPKDTSRIAKCLREQQGIEIQSLEVRLLDFAMEFYCHHATMVDYEGLSCFLTQEGGSYQANILASQSQLMTYLHQQWQAKQHMWQATQCPSATLPQIGHSQFVTFLQTLAHFLQQALQYFVAPYYTGPVGVDLMLCPMGVHPCVEINLRNTMGRVALHIAQTQKDSQIRLMQPRLDALHFNFLNI